MTSRDQHTRSAAVRLHIHTADPAVQQLHHQRTATTITSAGNRNPANAERGGDQGRNRAACFTDRACPGSSDRRNATVPCAAMRSTSAARAPNVSRTRSCGLTAPGRAPVSPSRPGR
jgi:hypothetical protein